MTVTHICHDTHDLHRAFCAIDPDITVDISYWTHHDPRQTVTCYLRDFVRTADGDALPTTTGPVVLPYGAKRRIVKIDRYRTGSGRRCLNLQMLVYFLAPTLRVHVTVYRRGKRHLGARTVRLTEHQTKAALDKDLFIKGNGNASGRLVYTHQNRTQSFDLSKYYVWDIVYHVQHPALV